MWKRPTEAINRSTCPWVFCRKALLKHIENPCAGVSFLLKFRTVGLQLYLKKKRFLRRSFPMNFENSFRILFYRIHVNSCFSSKQDYLSKFAALWKRQTVNWRFLALWVAIRIQKMANFACGKIGETKL